VEKSTKEELKVKFVVDPEVFSERIDVFLARQKDERDRDYGSRAYFQRMIGKGAVKVNGEYVEKPSHKVKTADKVEVILIEDDYAGELLPESIDLDIEYEDENFLFINKPSGMVVHPGAGNPSGTLANALLAHLHKEIVKDKEAEVSRKVGLAHRLDKDTSGGILVVKNSELLIEIMSLFEYRKIEKYYLAVCYHEGVKGRETEGLDLKPFDSKEVLKELVAKVESDGLPELERIANRLTRHASDRRKMMISETKGREALTEYRILGEVSLKPAYSERLAEEGAAKLSLVLLKPVSGRLHQLRVHMKSIGLPVLGDPVYGKGHEILNQMFLHSFWLGFELESSKWAKNLGKSTWRFKAELPSKWQEVLAEYAPYN
jgi:23S rRNA pseudouridine1911/1915/1917 synthase